MKKSTWLVVISLIIALVLFITGTVLGGIGELVDEYRWGNIEISLPFIGKESYNREFEEIKNLDIKAMTGDFEIIEYNDTKIEVVVKNISTRADVYQEGNTLVIKDKFRFSGLPFFRNTRVKIYVPKNYKFDEVSIDLDAGKFEIDNLLVDELKVDVVAGAFRANNIVANKTDIDVVAGDAKIDLLDSKNNEFDVDVGEIKVTMKGKESDYSYKADCGLGDIKIGSFRGSGLSNKHSYHSGERFIEAECNIGDIKIKMEV